MLESEIEGWIAASTGRTVRHLQRVGYGASRATFIAEMDSGPDLVARVDTGDGPMAETELSLAREAEAYRALEGTGVRIPRLHAVAPDGLRTAGGPCAGDARAAGPERRRPPPDRRRLHRRPGRPAQRGRDDPRPAQLSPPHRRSQPRRPTSSTCGAASSHTRTTQPWPLAEYALSVLRRVAPTTVSRTVLCHGDVGPGNYLHEDGKVTALLDWEFCHLGDPMDDLGGWLFRGYDMAAWQGDLAGQLRRWSDRDRRDACDPRSVEYYRAITMVRWLISVATTIENGGSGMDRSVHYALVPVLSVRLAAAPSPPCSTSSCPSRGLGSPSEEPGPGAPVLAALRDDLRDVIGPAVESPEGRRRLDGRRDLPRPPRGRGPGRGEGGRGRGRRRRRDARPPAGESVGRAARAGRARRSPRSRSRRRASHCSCTSGGTGSASSPCGRSSSPARWRTPRRCRARVVKETMELLTERDDDLHPPASDDRWWSETYWFSFDQPGADLSATIYPVFRPNASVCSLAVYLWDASGSTPWTARYGRSYWHLPMPETAAHGPPARGPHATARWNHSSATRSATRTARCSRSTSSARVCDAPTRPGIGAGRRPLRPAVPRRGRGRARRGADRDRHVRHARSHVVGASRAVATAEGRPTPTGMGRPTTSSSS